METILNLIIKIFLMIAFGYLLKRKRIITEDLQKGLTNLLLKAILPVSILSSASTEFTPTASEHMLIVVIIAAGYYIVALFAMTVISKFLRIKKQARNLFVTMAVFANTAFVGFPLVTEVYGTDHLIYAVIYNIFYQLFFFTYGTSILSGNMKFQFKSIYTNIVTIASFLSIAIFLSPIRFPVAVSTTLNSIGSMTVPISMIIIGCSLAEIKLWLVLKDFYSYIVSVFRLLLFPIGLMFLLKLLEVPQVLSSVCVIMTALPSGSLNAIYAEQYNCEPEFATRTVVQTMVLMIVTIPVIILLLHYFK